MFITQETIEIIQSFFDDLPLYKTDQGFRTECDEFIEALKENDLEKIKKELNDVINAMPEEKRKEFKDKLKEISNANNFTFEDCLEINTKQFAK